MKKNTQKTKSTILEKDEVLSEYDFTAAHPNKFASN